MTRFIPARLRTTVTGILTIVQGLPVPAATSGQSVAPAQMSPAEVAQIVEEAYIYGFPMSGYLNLLLQFCPPVGTAEVEKPLRAKFASIGIGPGKTIPHKDLSPEQKAPVAEALKGPSKRSRRRPTASASRSTVGRWAPRKAIAEHKPRAVVRVGDRSLENIIRTDERYGHDGLFQGPRGKVYWDHLEHPRPIQNPNLWPDTQSTYFIARLAMPAGSTLTLRFKYPHARYLQFALYKCEHNTFVSINEALAGREIEPDPGSTNPFLVGSDRLAEKRDFMLRFVAENAPADPARRAKNTLYAGRDGEELVAVIRIYLPDQGRDGAGWGPATSPFSRAGFPTYEATLADGTRLSAAQVVRQFARPTAGAIKPPLTVDQWIGLVHAKTNDPTLDPATAPARNPPRWEKFWTLRYSVLGAFKTSEERAKIPYAGAREGGGDPTTQYLVTYLSRKFGLVYVVRGKMPTFPNTYAGEGGTGLAVMPEAQSQYWSIVSCEAAPSGQVVDGLTDMQVPLDADRNYTIVVSRREDRPKNATLENGVAWLEWSPRGEGLDDPRNREDFGMLMMRIMANNPNWAQSPDKVTKPGMEEAVMGPYYPRGEYTDKATFEAKGPNK